MRRNFRILALTANLTIASAVVLANSTMASAQPAPEKSTGQIAEDVATQPVEDIGIDKREIPEVLQEITEDPYSLSGLRTCKAIGAAVTELDAVLGDDLDVKQDKDRDQKRKETAGRVGGMIVNSLIPFRSLIREVSGAASRERRYNEAVYAGVARRSFLKGIGQQRGCKYPAASNRSK